MQRFSVLCLSLSMLVATACNDGGNTEKSPASGKSSSLSSPVEILQQQLKKNPEADSLREKLTLLLLQQQAYTAAIAQADTLLLQKPGNPAYLFMKADALERRGDTTAAILHFREAITSAGIFADASLRLANLLAENGNSEALTICDELIQLPAAASMRSHVLFTKGIYFVKSKQQKQAISIFDQLIREDHVYMDAYIEKGLVYYDMGNFAEAYKVFILATEVSNAYADGYFWMAKCEEKMGKKEEAIANFKRSIALDTSISEAKEALQKLEKKP